MAHLTPDPNAQNRIGQTPLHLACIGAHKEAVRVLLKGGARVEQVRLWQREESWIDNVFVVMRRDL